MVGSIKFGTQKVCPKCKQYNPSGVKLPDGCWFCKDLIDPIAQKLLDDSERKYNRILRKD